MTKQIDMPTFELPDEGFSPSTNLSSISIICHFTDILSVSHGSPAARKTAKSLVGSSDEAIIDIGRPVEEVPSTAISSQPRSPMSSIQRNEFADAVFFESLLTNKTPVNKKDPPAKASKLIGSSAGPALLESLTNQKTTRDGTAPDFKGPITQNGAASDIVDEEALATIMAGRAHETLNEAASRVDKITSDRLRLSSALDLAVSRIIPKPRHLLAELDLDVTLEQILLHSQCVEQADIVNNATGNAHNYSVENDVQYHQPNPPRPDAMAYEMYSLPGSQTLIRSSSGTTASSSDKTNNQRPSTNSSFIPNAGVKMHFVFEQEPLEETQWLEFVNIFHSSGSTDSSAESGDADALAFSDTIYNDEDSIAENPVINLPLVDKRQVKTCQVSQNSSDGSIMGLGTVDHIALADESYEDLLRVKLPTPTRNSTFPHIEPKQEVREEKFQKAIHALDVATVFGSNPDDWSDDIDTDETGPGYEQELRMKTTQGHARRNAFSETESLTEVQVDIAPIQSDWDQEVQTSPSSSNITFAEGSPPLRSCYRLPAQVIKTINVEFCRIWDNEGPWTAGSDEDKVFELALTNVRSVHEDLPEDVLLWVRQVNSEFSRLLSMDLHAEFDKIMAVALSNVEWHYFCYCLKDLPKAELNGPSLEAAASPKDWIIEAFGSDTQDYEPPCSESIAGSRTDETSIVRQNENQQPNASLVGDDPDECAIIPMSSPFWATCAPRCQQVFDATNPHGRPNACPTRSCPVNHNGASPLSSVVSIDDILDENTDCEPPQATPLCANDSSDEEASDNAATKEDVQSPVTPALLIQLPNRVEDAHFVDLLATEDEVDYTVSSSENISEADTDIEDVDFVTSRRHIHYNSGNVRLPLRLGEESQNGQVEGDHASLFHHPEPIYDNDFVPTTSALESAGSCISLSNSPDTATKTIGASQETASLLPVVSKPSPESAKGPTSERSTCHNSISAKDQSFSSQLRQHHFFTVARPELVARNVRLFPTQESAQAELEQIIDDLSDFNSDDGLDQYKGTPDHVNSLVVEEDSVSALEAAAMKQTLTTGGTIADTVEDKACKPTRKVVKPDRTQATLRQPFARGSFGDFAVGALYVGVQFLKWIIWL